MRRWLLGVGLGLDTGIGGGPKQSAIKRTVLKSAVPLEGGDPIIQLCTSSRQHLWFEKNEKTMKPPFDD